LIERSAAAEAGHISGLLTAPEAFKPQETKTAAVISQQQYIIPGLA